mmetsp:Transcript_6797/g.12059  ORF Transcript_6797/g.12059 Transcript_6797/m.12059 type:complete len:212 (-) Transcript_6797:195-830(-)
MPRGCRSVNAIQVLRVIGKEEIACCNANSVALGCVFCQHRNALSRGRRLLASEEVSNLRAVCLVEPVHKVVICSHTSRSVHGRIAAVERNWSSLARRDHVNRHLEDAIAGLIAEDNVAKAINGNSSSLDSAGNGLLLSYRKRISAGYQIVHHDSSLVGVCHEEALSVFVHCKALRENKPTGNQLFHRLAVGYSRCPAARQLEIRNMSGACC